MTFFDRDHVVKAAGELIDTGMTRPAVVKSLCGTFGFSQPAARKLVDPLFEARAPKPVKPAPTALDEAARRLGGHVHSLPPTNYRWESVPGVWVSAAAAYRLAGLTP